MIGSCENSFYVPRQMVLSLHRHPHIFTPTGPMLGRGCDDWAETSPDHLVASENPQLPRVWTVGWPVLKGANVTQKFENYNGWSRFHQWCLLFPRPRSSNHPCHLPAGFLVVVALVAHLWHWVRWRLLLQLGWPSLVSHQFQLQADWTLAKLLLNFNHQDHLQRTLSLQRSNYKTCVPKHPILKQVLSSHAMSKCILQRWLDAWQPGIKDWLFNSCKWKSFLTTGCLWILTNFGVHKHWTLWPSPNNGMDSNQKWS